MRAFQQRKRPLIYLPIQTSFHAYESCFQPASRHCDVGNKASWLL